MPDVGAHGPTISRAHGAARPDNGRAHRETRPRHASHGRLRHVRQRGTMARMVKTKRVALSLTVSDSAAQCLRERAAREGHRYPLAFAAALLERALGVPAASSPRGEWLSDIGGVARVFGGSVAVEGDRVTLSLESKTTPAAVEWLRGRVMANHPPPDGVVFEVRV